MRAPVSHVVTAQADTMPALVLGAVGVVFGDIGTSPIYTLKVCLKAVGVVNPLNVFGIASLIFWSILVVVTLKYVSFVMRADNDGEGGILALTALAARVAPLRLQQVLLTIGVFGAAMFYGDSMITPAISVLSAVEGLALVDKHLAAWIVPIALLILAGLFLLQKRGTGVVGKLFGPVMIVWFVTLAALGLFHIVRHPGILEATSPFYAVSFVARNPGTAFIVLGSVFLALTGAEALYADMGQFGKQPIQRAWLLLVLPSLILNYFGQSALVLANASTIQQPFFQSAPSWALMPLVLLATVATIIASQAVISGAFSMTRQAIQLGFLPRIKIVHTSTNEKGQIYVPFINACLFLAVVSLVIFFKASDNLAAAYGIAVASTMLLTTLLMYFITHYLWKWPFYATLTVISPLALVDLVFVSSNISKVLEGGWFPLLAGLALFTVMTSWHRGRQMVIERIKAESPPLHEFVASLCKEMEPPFRVVGTAVFPGGIAGITPSAFTYNLKHNHVLHTINIFLAGTTKNSPFVPDEEKAVVRDLGYGCYSVIVRHGFMETPDIPKILKLVESQIADWRYKRAETSFFVMRDTVLTTGKSKGMALWRKKLFAFLGRNAVQAAQFYSLPLDRVVELGGPVNL